MKGILTYILVGGASALAGGIAGYFICKRKLQNDFDNELSNAINEEIGRIRNAHNAVIEADKNEDISTEIEFSEPVETNYYEEAKSLIETEFSDCESLNEYRVSLIASKITHDMERGASSEEITQHIVDTIHAFEQGDNEEGGAEFDDEEDIEDESYEMPQHIMSEWDGRIEVVPLEEYRALPPYFEFLTYQYFEEDDVLVDDGDEIITDIDGTVGDALLHFDEEPDDGDCVYVVNGNTGNAIEITRLHTSYASWAGFER